MGGAGRRGWLGGYRSVKIVYTAGYANRAAVPAHIADVCRGLVARKWKEISGSLHSYASRQDATGNIERYLPADVTSVERQALSMHRKWDRLSTGEGMRPDGQRSPRRRRSGSASSIVA